MDAFISAVVLIVMIGYGLFAAGQDVNRQHTIKGCIDANSAMSHKEVVPYCTDMVDTWSGLKQKETK